MCTAMMQQTPHGETFFGRTMDFSYELEPEFFFFPKGCRWENIARTHRIHTQYSFMGIGQDIDPVILADGVNEAGFAAAALYFPGYAQYDEIAADPKAPPIAALELIKLLLSICSCVKQVAAVVRSIRIVGVKDPVTNSVAPLHWITADKSGACLAIERTSDGLHLVDNPIGVLANSPDLRWHLANLRNYANVSPNQQPQSAWGPLELTPFGQGAGTWSLPGDYTPPSRFVRTAYLKSHTQFSDSRDEAALACFHILESVSIPKGVVMTAQGTSDYTQYTVLTDLVGGEYFFKAYNGSEIVSVPMPHCGGSDVLSLGKPTGPLTFRRLRQEC